MCGASDVCCGATPAWRGAATLPCNPTRDDNTRPVSMLSQSLPVCLAKRTCTHTPCKPACVAFTQPVSMYHRTSHLHTGWQRGHAPACSQRSSLQQAPCEPQPAGQTRCEGPVRYGRSAQRCHPRHCFALACLRGAAGPSRQVKALLGLWAPVLCPQTPCGGRAAPGGSSSWPAWRASPPARRSRGLRRPAAAAAWHRARPRPPERVHAWLRDTRQSGHAYVWVQPTALTAG